MIIPFHIISNNRRHIIVKILKNETNIYSLHHLNYDANISKYIDMVKLAHIATSEPSMVEPNIALRTTKLSTSIAKSPYLAALNLTSSINKLKAVTIPMSSAIPNMFYLLSLSS